MRHLDGTIVALLLLTGIPSCSLAPGPPRQVSFVVSLDSAARGGRVFLTGNTVKMGSWNPAAIPLTRISDSLYSATVLLPEGESVEYKVTGGSWWTEALDSTQHIFANFTFTVRSDTTLRIHVYDWLNRMILGRPVYSQERFRPKRSEVRLDDLWRYRPGDSAVWATPEYNDSDWVVTDPFIRWEALNDPQWKGIGWFRFHMDVDSSLWNRTLAMRIRQLGASQIYYNGRLIYTFGTVGTEETTKPNAMSWWREFQVEPRYEQLLAVRYASYDRERLMRLGLSPGFLISLRDLNTAFKMSGKVREDAAQQTVFFVIPIFLFFLHISLYGFFRKRRENLYYAACMLGFAGLTYFNYEKNVVVDVDSIILFTKLNALSVALAIFFGLMTIFETSCQKLPKRVWAYFGIYLMLSASTILGFGGQTFGMLNYVFFGFTIIEGTLANLRKPGKNLHGGSYLLAGFLVLSGFIILQILVDYGFMTNPFESAQPYALGMIGLAVSMSVFLSYNFARVNRDLEAQVDNVKRLSEQQLEQERLAHTLAIERRTIELESERKGAELESARQLQLSLLPKSVPQLDGLDIAAFMKTATEVGGDYYDFFTSNDGVLTVVLGDATGHGLKAGNLVTATKGLLNVLAGTGNIEEILTGANRAIKGMDLRMLTMCLSAIRINGNSLRYTSAGMPPLLLYKASSGQCEQRILKAMPLGAVTDFPYSSMEVPLHTGDVIVMASDGLHEFFNEERDTYGIEKVMESLSRHATQPAAEIIRQLFADAQHWGRGAPLEDDLTIVAVKKTVVSG